MKAKVIRENCIGCGACQAIAPNIFEIDDEGLSKVIAEEIDDNEEEDFKAVNVLHIVQQVQLLKKNKVNDKNSRN